MKYQFKGIETSTGADLKGEVEASTESEANQILNARKIEVYELQANTESNAKPKRVKKSDLVIPLQELATMLTSGVTLSDALSAIAANKTHSGVAEGFKKVIKLIESGEKLSVAIKESSMPFPDYVEYLVMAGELSGEMASALNNAANQMAYEQEIFDDVKGALTYPLLLILAGVSAVLIIFFAVVPKFSHLLREDQTLPFLAELVLRAGLSVNESPEVIAIIIGGGISVVIPVFVNPRVRYFLMNLAIQTPIVGSWLSEVEAARWSSLASAMLHAKVDLLAALTLCAKSCGYTQRKKRAFQMITDIEHGKSFAEALTLSNLLPKTSLNLVIVGDKTGQLANMLSAASQLHDKACKRRMKQVVGLMEPAAIIIVGLLIGIMIMGIVMAITASTNVSL